MLSIRDVRSLNDDIVIVFHECYCVTCSKVAWPYLIVVLVRFSVHLSTDESKKQLNGPITVCISIMQLQRSTESTKKHRRLLVASRHYSIVVRISVNQNKMPKSSTYLFYHLYFYEVTCSCSYVK